MHASNPPNSCRFLCMMSRRISYGRCFLGFAPSFSSINTPPCRPRIRRVLDELSRQQGVLSPGENLCPSLIAKLTFNLLNSHHGRANFPQISATGGQQTFFYRLKHRGIDFLLRVCRECLNLLSILHILTDKGLRKVFKLWRFIKISEVDLFSEFSSPGRWGMLAGSDSIGVGYNQTFGNPG